jgi:hypothetical protein
MSHVKVHDLSPAPNFARFPEDPSARPLTVEEMRAVRGGSSAAEQKLLLCRAPDPFPEWMRGWLNGIPGFPPGLPTEPYFPVDKAPETPMPTPCGTGVPF